MSDLMITVAIVYFVACGVFTAKVASAKGYDSIMWFFAGFFFNIISLIAISGLPDSKPSYRANESLTIKPIGWECSNCHSINVHSISKCSNCGSNR